MQYAAVDIGTNSCRLLVAEVNGGKVIPRERALKTTRLGEGLTLTGKIKMQAIERTVQAVSEFNKIIERYQEVKVGVVATSAAREASNTYELIEAIKKKTGYQAKVISGEEEARLTYLGATASLPLTGTPVLIDIGGGSTEIVFKKKGTICAYSAGVGAVKCTENLMGPTALQKELEGPLIKVKNIQSQLELVGVGGTITTLAAIDKCMEDYNPDVIHNSILRRTSIENILIKLSNMSLEERKKIAGLQPERADIIIAGTLIIWTILTYLQKEKIRVSEADLLHGIILSLQS